MSLAPSPPSPRIRGKDAPPTPRMMEVFTFIYECARDRGCQPTYRDISLHFGGKNASAFIWAIRALSDRGWLRMIGGGRHGVVFLRKPNGEKFDGFADKPAETTG